MDLGDNLSVRRRDALHEVLTTAPPAALFFTLASRGLGRPLHRPSQIFCWDIPQLRTLSDSALEDLVIEISTTGAD